jgi:dTDP-glucose 4,6-dehydratase
MKIFVTGGAGFIGSNFIHCALSLGKSYRVVNYDKLTYAGNLANLEGIADRSDYQFVHGDICDAKKVRASMHGCDAVVHFAAESHVDRSIYEPAPVIKTNVTGTFTLLEIAHELHMGKFVHVSTDEVYGDMAPGESAREDCPLCPNNPYSASKAAADLLVRSFVQTYGFPGVITRSSNNYGPYQFPEKFLPLLISNVMENQPLPIYGDGQQERDWIYVEDHCRAILEVLERGQVGEVYNIGAGNVRKNVVMVRAILELLRKLDSPLTYVQDRPGHDRRYSLDCAKIRRELGWRPRIPLEDGLRRTVAWYQQSSAWLKSVRDGDYRNYYEKYYLKRDQSLARIATARGTLAT